MLRFELKEETDWLKRIKIQAKIDELKRGLRTEGRKTYQQQVVDMYNDYEAMVFNLSEESSNETIESIKRMTLGDRMKFQQLIVARNRKKNGRQKV